MTVAHDFGALPAFRACSAADLNRFVSTTTTRHFAPKTPLIRQGDAAQGAWLIVSGRCRVDVVAGDHALTIGHAGPGELVGELGLFTSGSRRSATVVAETAVAAFGIPMDLLDNDTIAPVLAIVERRALSSLAERVRHNTGSVRRCDDADAGANTSESWSAGFVGTLHRLFGG